MEDAVDKRGRTGVASEGRALPLALEVAMATTAVAAAVWFGVLSVRDAAGMSLATAILGLVAGLLFVLAGLVAQRRRPGNRTGMLMIATGAALIAGRSVRQFEFALVYTVGTFTFSLFGGFFAHLVLAYPSGRLTSRTDRLYVASLYFVTAVYKPVTRFFNDPDALGCSECPDRLNLLYIDGTSGAYEALTQIGNWLLVVPVGLVIVRLIARWRVATPPARRTLLPAVAGGVSVATATFVLIVVQSIEALPAGPTLPGAATVSEAANLLERTTLVILPLALLAGLLRTRVTRSIVGSLIVELSEIPPPERLRDLLARALGDPSLEVGFRVGDHHVDADGRPLPVPEDDPSRAVTPLMQRGEPLGVLIHDRALLEDEGLLDAVGAAARLAVHNARLQAEIRARLREIHASRERIVEAADEERRRIERDIHDGAQQRLVALSMALRMLHRELGSAIDPRLEELIVRAEGEARAAIAEVRELALGVHPKVLSDEGLDAALVSLAERASTPVRIHGGVRRRLAPAVEGAAYFVCCEALANVAKHADAPRADVYAAVAGDRLEVAVHDGGCGGASVADGKGLRGLADRVEALGGSLSVSSEPGGGTRVSASIPVGNGVSG